MMTILTGLRLLLFSAFPESSTHHFCRYTQLEVKGFAMSKGKKASDLCHDLWVLSSSICVWQLLLLEISPAWSPVLWDNVGEPGAHPAQWNELDTEGQIPHDSTYMMYLKIVQHIEAENTMVLARSWGVEQVRSCCSPGFSYARGIKSRHLLYRVSNMVS